MAHNSIGYELPNPHLSNHNPDPPTLKRKNAFPDNLRLPPMERRNVPSKGVLHESKKQENIVRGQTRLNRIQESDQMQEWVSQEDAFVLKQAKKKAQIRVREGRAKPIDFLAVALSVVDPTRDLLEDDEIDPDLDVISPDYVFDGMSQSQLQELGKDIDVYITLESDKSNCEYWKTLKIVCEDRISRTILAGPESRAVSSVSSDIDRLLGPKSYKELSELQLQINKKLQSNEPIDVDYWEQLLQSLTVWKAKAKLKEVYQSIIDSRLSALKQQQETEAGIARGKLAILLNDSRSALNGAADSQPIVPPPIQYSEKLDPPPFLKLLPEDKALNVIEEKDFLSKIALERQKILRTGYVPLKQRTVDKAGTVSLPNPHDTLTSSASRLAVIPNEDFSQATKALYEREVARGVSENEEIFAGEEEVSSTQGKPQWAGKYRPRKPRYFNRVQMGYEWNKYNQTHYDHDNPPPKVVQGYKFNIFYPDLIDKTKAPTYRIERENGRKRGQSFAPAGEEDTCLIRFISSPPYEDLAFKIVDKEWDYSAKRERGFRSSFDKGILQLHFQFKKVYYRK